MFLFFFFLITSQLEKVPLQINPVCDQSVSTFHPCQGKINFLSWTCFWRPCKIKVVGSVSGWSRWDNSFHWLCCGSDCLQQGSDNKQLADRGREKELPSVFTTSLSGHCLRLLDTEEWRICLTLLVPVSLFLGTKHLINKWLDKKGLAFYNSMILWPSCMGRDGTTNNYPCAATSPRTKRRVGYLCLTQIWTMSFFSLTLFSSLWK